MSIGIFIGVLLFFVLFLGSNVYIGRTLGQGLKKLFPRVSKRVWSYGYGALVILSYIGMLPWAVPGKRIFAVLGAYYIGFYGFALMSFLVLDVGSFLLMFLTKRKEKGRAKSQGARALVGMGLILVLMVYSTHQANLLHVVHYDVQLTHPQAPEKMRVVLISDLHLGAVGSEKRLPELVARINGAEPDLVVIPGDIFDDDFHLIKDPAKAKALLSSISATHGVYASFGNHDGGETFPLMVNFLEESGITVLLEEFVLIEEELLLLGRLDPSPIGGFGTKEREETTSLLAKLPKEYPVMVLDHTPSDPWQYGEKVDLVLSGHTHGGQVFPLNLFTRVLFEVDYGMEKIHKGPLYVVTSGSGTWGPPMRLGTKSELVILDLSREN